MSLNEYKHIFNICIYQYLIQLLLEALSYCIVVSHGTVNIARIKQVSLKKLKYNSVSVLSARKKIYDINAISRYSPDILKTT